MSELDHAPTKHQRIIHGFVFLIVLLCTTAVPALLDWPWPWLAPWLAPLLGYFAVMLCIPSLRSSFSWLHFGRITPATVAATLLIIVLTMTVLVLISQPHFPGGLGHMLPFQQSCGALIAGALFSIINATVQEFVFRGVLFDSLDSIWGRWGAILVSAFIFGIGHLLVLPSGISGILGASAAADFGLAVGCLRSWSGGLALPILAHIAADATIIYRAVHAGTI
ncbi:MAG: CPBP family intramembrane metalloprotease [Verrucomicrobia bacterium]|nr:MAG: CPBP family intramembrane metalloprotease [Verrucomicrobiota bacterium]